MRDTRPFGTRVKRSINLGPLGLRGDPLMLEKVGGDLTQSANRSGGQT